MAMAGAEAPYDPSEPSPWWLKGLAIFMALLTVYMLLGVASGILSPVLVDRFVPDDYADIEPYPEDGTEEEKAEWDRSNGEWDVMVEYIDGMMADDGILSLIQRFASHHWTVLCPSTVEG